MRDERAEEILRILRETFAMPEWATINEHRDPFRTLVRTIISQNTADRNTAKAFESLSKRFEITPEALAKAKESRIKECLKVAGLYRNKAKVIKQISTIVVEQFHSALEPMLALPFEEARKTLLQLPGVGPKTADVVLLFSAEQPTIPVDTHVNRVARRLGLAPSKGDYEAVRSSLQSLFNRKDFLTVHLLLIQHGRRYCKARKPLCKQCPVNALCPSRYLWDKDD